MRDLAGKLLRHITCFAKAHKKLSVLIGLAGGMSVVPVLLLAGNQAVQMVDSSLFCTKTCHSVHLTEAATIQQSAHYQVSCASCHVGSGTANLVKSKVKGLTEILPTLTGNYEKPIPALLKNRVATTQTCETCHAPGAYSGDVPIIKTSFASDKANTKSTSTLVLKLDGGSGRSASGIHWHATANIWYYATDPQQNDIAWVAVEDSSGKVTQYANPKSIGQVNMSDLYSAGRPMDCLDCHNRVAHPIQSAAELIDAALTDGSLDVTLPFIKLIAINAVTGDNLTLAEANKKIDEIANYYRTNYPDVFSTEERSIIAATGKLRGIAELTILPNGQTPTTYPDNNVHNQPASDGTVDFSDLTKQGGGQGCFRCHGTLVRVGSDTVLPQASSPKNRSADLKSFLAGISIADIQAAAAATVSEANAGQQGRPVSLSSAAYLPAEKTSTILPSAMNADCNLCHYTPASGLYAGGAHVLPVAPLVPHPVDGLENCLICHNPTGPQPFKNTHNWATNGACLACHQLSPEPKPLPTDAPPKAPDVPHTTGKLETCLVCHGPRGSKPMKNDHPWVTDKTCDACHRLSPKPEPLPAALPPKSPEIPHGIDNLDNCLVCHGPTGPKPFKPDHAWVTDETCQACHKLSKNPEPLPAVVPPKAPEIPHSTSKLDNCLVCHSPAGPKPIKPDHAWVTNETCSACHRISPNPLPIEVVAPANVPLIPHLTAGLETCLACHGPLAPKAFGANHPWVTDDVCSACHKPSPNPIGTKPEPLPASPAIPHSVTGLGACSACHYSGGPGPFSASHAGRPDSFCLICHQVGGSSQPPASLPAAPTVPHSITGLSACSMCHYSGGPAPFSPNHAGRPDSFCLICHKTAPTPTPALGAAISFFSDPAATQAVSVLEMGNLAQGATTSVTYYVKNTGSVPVTLTAGPTDLPAIIGTLTFTFDGLPQETVARGAIATIVATFHPAAGAVPGDVNFTFSVNFTDATGAPSPTPTPSPSPSPSAVSFSATIQPILIASCAGCHGASGAAGISLNTYAGVKAIVIAGNAAASLLFQSLNGTGVPPMPPGGALTPSQIQSIADWINQSALNN